MLKFKPEDFYAFKNPNIQITSTEVAVMAQSIFDYWIKENAKVVYGLRAREEQQEFTGRWGEVTNTEEAKRFFMSSATHKALLINIEPIEKCSHPTDKVQWVTSSFVQESWFRCECGAKVRPKEFEVIDS